MKAPVGAFNQEKALVGAFSVIVQPVLEPMDRFTALVQTHDNHSYPSFSNSIMMASLAVAAILPQGYNALK